MKKKAGGFIHMAWILGMAIVTVIMAYPLLYALLGGFHTQSEFNSLNEILPIPHRWVINNYGFALSKTVASPLINTLLRTFWYTLLVVFMSVLAGYVLARYDFRFKNTFLLLIIAAQVVPSVLTLIPTFVMVSRIPLMGGNDLMGRGGQGLYNSWLMLYLPLSWTYLLWVFLFMQSVKGQSAAFEEAAEIDGCGFGQMLARIVVPMQKPILTVIAVNVSLNTWNDWMTPFLYINDTARSTLPAYLATLTAALQNYGVRDYPKVFALATVAIIPPAIIFLFLQKYIVQGIASAGVKG